MGINQQGQLVKLSLINCDGSQQSPWQTVLIEGTPESTKYVKVASNEHCVAAIDDAGDHIKCPLIQSLSFTRFNLTGQATFTFLL